MCFCKVKRSKKKKRLSSFRKGSETVKSRPQMVKIGSEIVKIDQIRRMCHPECAKMCLNVHICGGMSNLVHADYSHKVSSS